MSEDKRVISGMEEIEVFINNAGGITLHQEMMYYDIQVISIHPSQINTLIKMLRELKKEISENA